MVCWCAAQACVSHMWVFCVNSQCSHTQHRVLLRQMHKIMRAACFDVLGRKNPCTNSRKTILCEWGASSGVGEGVEIAPTKMRQQKCAKKTPSPTQQAIATS